MDHTAQVLDHLKNLGIPFELTRHPPATTIEDFYALHIDVLGDICKNLFVADSCRKRFFLVIIGRDKRADLKQLRGQLGTSRLSFAPEAMLLEKLNLRPGSVSPFGLIHAAGRDVEVILDQDLKGRPQLGFHPYDNTATVWLAMDGLLRFLQARLIPFRFIPISGP